MRRQGRIIAQFHGISGQLLNHFQLRRERNPIIVEQIDQFQNIVGFPAMNTLKRPDCFEPFFYSLLGMKSEYFIGGLRIFSPSP